MGVGRRRLAALWALALAVACTQHTGQAHDGSENRDLPRARHGPGGDPLGMVTVHPPLRTTPVVRALNAAHGGRVCSTWGDFHYKTFDGDVFRFPGLCNYVFSAHCGAAYEDFNIQLRRGPGPNDTAPSRVTMKLDGLVVELSKSSVLVNGRPVQLPFGQSGVLIDQSSSYVKVAARLGLVFMWNLDDSLLLELDAKYANQTCGLCGDFNGVPVVNELFSHNVKLTPIEFGNLQKVDGPVEQCQDTVPEPPTNCLTGSDVCEEMLSGGLLSGCSALVNASGYLDACRHDLCHCQQANPTSCACHTLAEYSRQCAHAGGLPLDWRGPLLCPQTCPLNMQYHECGSPCVDTCSNLEHSQLCEDHCIAGCFCPKGMVLDDIGHTGCIPVSQCSCVYNGATYAPGTGYSTDCANCTCSGGRWSCREVPCPGTCSVLGGAHFSTFDERQYTVHGDCSYVLTKPCDSSAFTVLAELRRCGLTDNENCLKSLTLSLGSGHTVIVVKASGEVFVNQIYTQLPVSAANVTLFRPSTFFIIAQTQLGLQLDIQLVPLMQVYVRLAPELRGQTCGLCGNFNQNQADDFRTISSVVEGTAAAFANTWKTQAACRNVKNSFEDPCSLSVDNEKYAQHWCSQLTDPHGPFARCHASVNPSTYYSNCMFDTCNCEKSEDCMCAALSSYVRACAAKGVLLSGWRDGVCTKPTATCPESMTYHYHISTCQPTCRARSDEDVTCSISFVPVDGCTCPHETFLDDTGKCVPATSCPCYHGGSMVPNGESLHESGVICSCTQGTLACIGGYSPAPACASPMIYSDCRNATPGAAGAGCQKSCHTLDMDCYSPQCVPGCVCPNGLVADGEGGCIPASDCPCMHNEASYQAGQTIRVGCNTCTCKSRMWQCTDEPCLATCAVYGDGHYLTFDGQRYSFSGDCAYTLAQDHCGGNGSAQDGFRVVTENIPCGTTGTTCSKAIKVFLGSYELKLSDGKAEVIEKDPGQQPPFSIRQMGIYLVVDTEVGLVLLWDKRTSIFLILSPEFKGRVCGLCGNFDDNALNDLTTRSQSVVGDVLEFGNSWKFSPSCPDAQDPEDPCTANPYRKSWAQKQCSIISGDAFSACHAHVEPARYYEACVSDACACDSGGDCECFCTAVAAYARACHEAGVCVSWRTPDICPLFCDYYNPQGHCEWHYLPCGAPCLKTCRNPSGQCLHSVHGLEGCYPKCPPEAPIFDEDQMQCVASCPTPPPPPPCRVQGKSYRPGSAVPSDENCHSCICTESGVRCTYDSDACVCTYGGQHFRPGDVIYHTADGTGGCISARCGANGTIERRIYACSSTSPTPQTTFSFSTPLVLSPTPPPGMRPSPDESTAHTPSSTPSTAPGTSPRTPPSVTTPLPTLGCEQQCQWSQWLDVSRPGRGTDSGDFDTLENLRAHGYQVCRAPRQVECRAEGAAGVPLQVLGQHVECSPQVGLTCYNRDQASGLCENYQIRILCCSPEDCTLSSTTSPVTSRTSNTPAPGSTTPAPGSTTPAPGPTTPAPGSTTPVPGSTTPAPGTTTPAPGTTTPAPGSTTPVPGTTTPAPGSTTPVPGTTTPAPGSTTPAPGTTTPAPGSTTPVPGTTTPAPGSTTPVPGTTTPAPGSTTPAPGSTTPVPGTTTPAPGSTTPVPGSTTPAPGTTTPAPGSTTPVPGTTTPAPGPITPVPSTTTPAPGPTTPAPGPNTPVPGTTTTVKRILSTSSPMLVSTVSTTTSVPTTAPGTSSPPGTSTLSDNPCLRELCTWTEWIDGSYPGSERNSGDFDTFQNLRSKGYKFCANPRNVECRAERFPNTPLQDLGQDLICDKTVGLICRNEDQLPPICYNYEIRILCCEVVNVCTTNTSPSTVPGATPWTTRETSAARTTVLPSPSTLHSSTSSPPVSPASRVIPSTHEPSPPGTSTTSAPTTSTTSARTTGPPSAPTTSTTSERTTGPHSAPTTSTTSERTTGPPSAPTTSTTSERTTGPLSTPTTSTTSERTTGTPSAPTTSRTSARTTGPPSAPTTSTTSERTTGPPSAPTTSTTSERTTGPHSAPTTSTTSERTTGPHSAPTTSTTSERTTGPPSAPTTSTTSARTTGTPSAPTTSTTSARTTGPPSAPTTSTTSERTTGPHSAPTTSTTSERTTGPPSAPTTSTTSERTTGPLSAPTTSTTSERTTGTPSAPTTSRTSARTTGPPSAPTTSTTSERTTGPPSAPTTSTTSERTTGPHSAPTTSTTSERTTGPHSAPTTSTTSERTTGPPSAPTTSTTSARTTGTPSAPTTSTTSARTTGPPSAPTTSTNSERTTGTPSAPTTSTTSERTTGPPSAPTTSTTSARTTGPHSTPTTSTTSARTTGPHSAPTTSTTSARTTGTPSAPTTSTTSARTTGPPSAPTTSTTSERTTGPPSAPTTSTTSERTTGPPSAPTTSTTSERTTGPPSAPTTSTTSERTTGPPSAPTTSTTSARTTGPPSAPTTSTNSERTTGPPSAPTTSTTSERTTGPPSAPTTSTTSEWTTGPPSAPTTSTTSERTTGPPLAPTTSTTSARTTGPPSAPTTSTNSERTTGTPSAPTTSTTPVPTPGTPYSTSGATTCLPQCAWTKWFDVDVPSPGPDGGDSETYSNITRRGEKICHRPEHIAQLECRAESHPEVSITALGQVVQCNPKVGLVCRNRDQSSPFTTCFNYQIRVLCCEPPKGCPVPSVTPFVTLSKTPLSPESTTTVSSVTPPSSTEPSTTTCYCSVSGNFYPAGSIIYQQTDLSDHCYYAVCSLDCHVVRRTDHTCPTSTPSLAPTTSPPRSSPSTSVPPEGCPNAVPPRTEGETWAMPNCSQATCKGNGIITVRPRQCPAVKKLTCANGYPPVSVADDEGCCLSHYECQCVCSGWGDPHYITFDGTYYTFLDNCTYVLVQQIVPVFGHFRVLIQNYFCDAEDRLSCPQSIIVEYRQDRVVLTRKPVHGVMTNEIIFDGKVVSPGFQKDGIVVSQTGIKMYVAIPELGVQVMFSGLIFSVEVPFSKFANNTEGQCGTCTNNQEDECRLPGGAVVASCSDMSSHWKVTVPDQPSCDGPPPTPIIPRTTATPCPPSPICQLILSEVFELCHTVLPPWPYYQGCLFDQCHMPRSDVMCSSLELYASLCASHGVCVDWRGQTNRTCSFTCPADKVYQPCGPSSPSYCYTNHSTNAAVLREEAPFTEGCFCPEGRSLFSRSSEVCVPDDCASCLGPHGEPVEPGHTVHIDCQECTCEGSSQTMRCQNQACPPPPACPEPGFTPEPADPQPGQCCPQYHCACNTSYCPQPVGCPEGARSILTHKEGACCPSQSCSWTVCSVNSTLYQPGAVVSSNLCETCRCEVPGGPQPDTFVISCETQICNTQCPAGFEYQEQGSQCCGSCVQVACVANVSDGSAILVPPGESWSDPDSPCVTHKCEKQRDVLVVTTVRKECPPLSCSVDKASLSEDGCCLLCNASGSSCSVHHKHQVLQQQGCSSPEPVRLSYCQGKCGDTASMYSLEASGAPNSCRCCQELRVSRRNVTLHCADGSRRAISYAEVEECGCVGQRCDSPGDLSHSEEWEPEQSEEQSEEHSEEHSEEQSEEEAGQKHRGTGALGPRPLQ